MELSKLSIPKLVAHATDIDADLGDIAKEIARKKKAGTKDRLIELIQEWGDEPEPESEEPDPEEGPDLSIEGLHVEPTGIGKVTQAWLNSFIQVDGDQLTAVAIPTVIKSCDYDGQRWCWLKFGPHVKVKVTEGSDLAEGLGVTWEAGHSYTKAKLKRGKVMTIRGIWFELPDETISLRFQETLFEEELTEELKKARYDVYRNWSASVNHYGSYPEDYDNPYTY